MNCEKLISDSVITNLATLCTSGRLRVTPKNISFLKFAPVVCKPYQPPLNNHSNDFRSVHRPRTHIKSVSFQRNSGAMWGLVLPDDLMLSTELIMDTGQS